MANHKSSAKRARQDILKNEKNSVKKTTARSVIKKVRDAITAKDKETAAKLLPSAQKLLARLAKHGIIKPGTAGRKVSRLSGQINAL